MKRSTSIRSLFTVCNVALILSSPAIAGIPLGGLTVAISPDGKTLVAGGDTRTLLIIDPESLEVKIRVWVETTITDLYFSKDGGTLLIGDSSDRVLLYMSTVGFAPMETLTAQNGKLSAIAGWPEYVKGFSTNAEGPIYAATTAYRVVRFSRNGNVEKEAPVK